MDSPYKEEDAEHCKLQIDEGEKGTQHHLEFSLILPVTRDVRKALFSEVASIKGS